MLKEKEIPNWNFILVGAGGIFSMVEDLSHFAFRNLIRKTRT